MNGTRTLWRRSALLAIAVAAAITVVALPATALAKTTTKFSGLGKTQLFENDDPNSPLHWPLPIDTVKLQKKTSHGYKSLSGTVYLYKLNDDTGKYVKIATAPKGTSASFSIPGIGRYKVYYSGSSTYKSCTAYTNAVEKFGFNISEPDVAFDPIPGSTDTWVSVSYDVDWNTNEYDSAVDGPMMLEYFGAFHDQPLLDDSDNAFYSLTNRYIWAPGPVEFKFRCGAPELLSFLTIQTSVQLDSPYLVVDGPDEPTTVPVLN